MSFYVREKSLPETRNRNCREREREREREKERERGERERERERFYVASLHEREQKCVQERRTEIA